MKLRPLTVLSSLLAGLFVVGCGGYPLHEAIAVGDIESLKKHLEAGADVDRKNQADNTPLFTAAGLACFGANIGELRQSFPREKVLNAMAATLISSGADINSKNQWGMTPLHEVAKYGCSSIADLLISNGADLNAMNIYGDTPLFTAFQYGKFEMFEFFIQSGANVNKADHGGALLYFAIADGLTNVVKILVENGAHVNAIDR